MAQNLQNKVSIRLMSGGHTLSKAEIDSLVSAECDVVEIVTPKTIVRPVDGFDPCYAQHDLEDTGYAVAMNECVVASQPKMGMVAIMAMSKDAYNNITAIKPNVVFTSPLIEGEAMEKGLYVALISDVLYVRVYNGGLRFAEAMTVASDADILYYMESIHRVYDIYNMYARAKGDTERLERACGRLFK